MPSQEEANGDTSSSPSTDPTGGGRTTLPPHNLPQQTLTHACHRQIVCNFFPLQPHVGMIPDSAHSTSHARQKTYQLNPQPNFGKRSPGSDPPIRLPLQCLARGSQKYFFRISDDTYPTKIETQTIPGYLWTPAALPSCWFDVPHCLVAPTHEFLHYTPTKKHTPQIHILSAVARIWSFWRIHRCTPS